MTTVNKSQLPSERQIVGGANRNWDTAHHRINEKSLIKVFFSSKLAIYSKLFQISNPDGRCLFYALVATLMHTIGGMPKQRFYYYLHNIRSQRGKFERDVNRLMNAVGIPTNLPEYKAKDFVPGVVHYW